MDGSRTDDASAARTIEALRERVRELERRLGDSGARGEPATLGELFEGFFHMSPVGLVCVAPDRRVLAANDRFCELLGYSREELGRLVWTDFTPPEDVDADRDAYAAFLHGERDRGFGEKRYLRKDGRVVEAAIHARLVRGPEGMPRYTLAAVEDITKRRLAERLARDKSEEIERFFELAIELLCITDREGRFQRVNAEWERVLGHPRETMVGRRMLEFVHPEDAEKTGEALLMLADRRDVRNFVNRCRCRDGSYRWLEWRATPVGEAIHAAARDVTDPMRAHASMRDSERLLRQIIDLVPLFIFAKDGESRFLLVNQAVADVYGTTVSALVGKPDREFSATEEEAERFHQDDLAVLRSGRPKVIPDERITDAEGRIHYLETTKIPFHYGPDRIPAILGVSADVTERRIAEERLAKSEALYRLLAETAQDVILLHDMQGRITYANPAAYRLSGYTEDELRSLDILDAIAPECRDAERGRMARRSAGDSGVFRYETEVFAKDGRRVSLEVSSTAIVEGGHVTQVLAVARDMTEMKLAAERLAESQALLAAAIEQSPSGILVADAPDVRIRYVNPAAFAIRGTTGDRLTAIPVSEHSRAWRAYRVDGSTPLPPEDLPLSRAVLRGEVVQNVEMIFRRDDGEDRRVAANAGPIRNARGDVIAGIVVFSDVTDQRRMEEALRQSESRYRLIAENVVDVIWTLDSDLRMTYVSPSVLRLIGRTVDETLSIGLDELLTPESFREALGILEQEMEQELSGKTRPGSARTLDLEMHHKSGGTIWTENEVAFLRDETGAARGFVGVTRDVTKRRLQEAALWESERRFREMLETVRLAAVMLDLDGRVTFANDHLAEMTGWRREELIGRDWVDTFVPEADRARARGDASMLRGASEAHFELPVVTRRGETRQIVWDSTYLRDPAGTVIGVASLGRDVTEIRRLEEQYLQAQKMEAIGQLAGGVAHDFNNLLQVISGYLEIAMTDLPPGSSPRNELEQVSGAASRAAALVRQLLTFSRRETVRREDLDLDRIIADTAKMLRRVIGEHIDLETVSGGPLPVIFADPGHMEQILLNLCINARDAMPHGGSLRIETAAVRLDRRFQEENPWAREGDFVLLVISDTGVGMPSEVLDHVFEPFFTTKEVGKGTGLGLATVYGIVRQHGGFLHVESEVGRGTVFRVYLPAARVLDRPAEDAPSAKPSAAGRGETILVAEDEEAVRELIAEVLEDAGYRVLVARDGQEAVQIFEQAWREVDLILMDAIMPRRSGRAAYDAMKTTDPSARVLFCSGYSFETLEAASFPEGSPDVLEKPFSPATLLAKVREALDRKA